MPLWIYHRPPEQCNRHEFQVAQRLSKLGPGWIVCWGYYYRDRKGGQREGDFLILGPDGHLAVLEVKKRLRQEAQTGHWDQIADSPVPQLLAERAGVIEALHAARRPDRDEPVPYVEAILLGCENRPDDPKPSGLDPHQILLGIDRLRALPRHWPSLMQRGRPRRNLESIRKLFLRTFGANLNPAVSRQFLAATDRLLLEQASADFELLDLLVDNRQLIIHGGPGSGKSWLAFEQANRLAAEGLDVLLLSYNRAFGHEQAERVRHLSQRRARGSITALTWEELARDLARQAGCAPDLLEDHAERAHFYEAQLPTAMLDAVSSGLVRPCYDALVVDEAQDHNTSTALGIGWWEIYLTLLRPRDDGPPWIAIFHDPAQRPAFRDLQGGRFDPGDLHRLFPHATRVRLQGTRRYTRQLAQFLLSLKSEVTAPLIEGVQPDCEVEGVPPRVEQGPDLETLFDRAGDLIRAWIDQQRFDAREILLLTRRDPFHAERGSLVARQQSFAGCRLVPAEKVSRREPNVIRCTSFNRSKGLDARAVILIDTPPFEALNADDQHAFWLAASRARQRLGLFLTEPAVG